MPAIPSMAKVSTSPEATPGRISRVPSPRRVLIAQDANAASPQLSQQLTAMGYEVSFVGDGREALRILSGNDAPRLALLHADLPSLDGTEVCRALRRQRMPAYVYVILLASDATAELVVASLNAGADGCLPALPSLERLQAHLGAAQRILDLQDELIAAREALREQAMRDSLTHLWNHGEIVEILARELERSQRSAIPVGVIMADLDHFKGINDTHGHLAGDEVLWQVARRLEGALRPYDSIGRYGGEEFLIVLPGCDTPSTLVLAERLRKAISGKAVNVADGPIPVTISLGVTSNQEPHASDVEALLRASDTALYRAKNLGRNRIERATAADVWGRLSG
jgi:two-component system, cell cycle response regulator